MPPELKAHFDQVVSCLDELAALPEPPQDKLAQLAEILANVHASPAYKDHFIATQEKIRAHLADHAGFPPMLESFKFMNADSQRQWLQLQVDHLAAFQSECGISIKPAEIRWVRWGINGDRARIGFDPNYDGPETQGICLNEDAPDAITCPIQALSTVLHEQWHQFDNTLARETKFGRMPQNHPLAADGQYFCEQWARRAFAKISPPYQVQLDERCATAFGRSVMNFLQDIKSAFTNGAALQRPNTPILAPT